jgi:hypothetical protein
MISQVCLSGNLIFPDKSPVEQSEVDSGVNYGAVFGVTSTSTVTQPTLPLGPCASMRQ